MKCREQAKQTYDFGGIVVNGERGVPGQTYMGRVTALSKDATPRQLPMIFVLRFGRAPRTRRSTLSKLVVHYGGRTPERKA